jgi:hypothetical protein
MGDAKSLAVARAYFHAWTSRDRDGVSRHLADDLVVEVPINSYAGKPDFLDAVCRTAQMTSSVDLIAELGDADQAMLLYDMMLPIGKLRVAEHFTISGGQIHKVRQIHDTAALRSAGFGQKGAH